MWSILYSPQIFSQTQDTTYWLITLKAYRDSGNFVSATSAFVCPQPFITKYKIDSLFIQTIKWQNPLLRKKNFNYVEILFLMKLSREEYDIYCEPKPKNIK
jgi:hypothetical protein